MAGAKVKGITIEFNGDTTKLGAALKDINSKAKGVDQALRKVNTAMRFNPKNAELAAQKQTLLKQKIAQTKAQLDAFRKAQSQLDADPSVDKTSQDYMELRREIITTESKLKHFEAEQKKLNNFKFTSLGNSLKGAGSKITAVGRTISTTMSVIGAGAIFAGSKLIKMSQRQAQAEQKLAEIYKTRMGVDNKAVQSTLKLATAQQKLGVVGDEVQIAGAQQLATYVKYPGSVNKMLPALNNLLVQQKGLNGTQEDATNLANMFGKAMMGQTGALKRAGISFSDAQAKILKTGTEEERAAMIAEVVTQNVGNMNAEFAKTDAGKMQQAKNALGDMGEEIGAILLPAVADLVHWFQDNLMPKIQSFIDFMQQHPAVAKFALAIAAIAAALGPVIMLIGSIVSGVGSLISFLPTLLSPIGLIIAGVAAAIAIGVALYKNWDKVKKFLLKIWNAIKKAVMTVFGAIKDVIVGYWRLVWTITKTIWTTIFNVLIAAWNAIKNAAKVVLNAIVGFFRAAWNAIKAAWSGVKQFFINIWNGIKAVFSAVGGWFASKFAAAASAIKSAFNGVKNFFSGIWAKIKGVFGNVAGFFRGKFQAAWNAIKNVFHGVASFFGGIWNTIKSKFTSLGKTIGSAISGAVATGINGVIGFIERAINGAIKLINGAIKLINKIPGVEIGKVKSVKLPRISWHAKGGIFDSPSVIGVGEAGPEAVVPLDKFWKKMDEMGSAAPIVVNVYGSDNMSVDDLANAVQNKIIQMQKRRKLAWQ